MPRDPEPTTPTRRHRFMIGRAVVEMDLADGERPDGVRLCKPWEEGDDRQGRVSTPCTTPGCTRGLAVTGHRRLDVAYVCGPAAAGYCRHNFGREYPVRCVVCDGASDPTLPRHPIGPLCLSCWLPRAAGADVTPQGAALADVIRQTGGAK